MKIKYNKVLSIFTLLFFIVSNTLCFIPCIEVKAAESMLVKDMMLFDYFPMTRSLYLENASTVYEEDSNYMQAFSDDDMSNFFNIPDDITIPNGYSKFEDLNITLGGIAGDTYPYAGMAVTKYINTYYLYVVQYIDDRELVEDDFSLYAGFLNSAGNGYNSPGAAFVSKNSLYITRYALNTNLYNNYNFVKLGSEVHITADSNIPFLCDLGNEHGWFMFDSQDALWQNISSTVIGSVFYCTMPLYLGYSNNDTSNNDLGFNQCNYPVNFLHAKYGVDKIYSNLNGSEINGCNESSEFFLKDRRLVFPDQTVDVSLNVDTDPISGSEIGVYNIDFYPSGDFLAGNITLENFQPSKAATEAENANFQARLTWSFTCNQFYTRTPQTIPVIEAWNIKNMNSAGVYEIVPNNSLECAFYYDGENHSFASRDLLSEATCDKDNDSHIQTTSGKRSYSMADLYSIFNTCGFTDTVTGAPTTKIRQSPAVKACTVTLTITCEYGIEQKSKQVANVTYDYISGETYKSGFTSTDNNTNPDDIPSDIQEGQNSITSGVSGVATSIAPQFINNNNPTITINNNPALNIPAGGDGNGGNDTDINTTINAAWDGIDFIKDWPTMIRENDFLNYLFSEDIWSIQPFNLILPALALIIVVSIATAIIRFVRGG